ncbi:hypothetical protein Nepgr_003918 [Nepenthes gracilis]|uniref:Uncharacterized protein n=1 Tax=Nepenthes gracilis TaxID=150966 RepID=A0AAD3S0E0_NEPGR|nr:hypothetical protein Nepgr_003918 [Nepenthes gracilis]
MAIRSDSHILPECSQPFDDVCQYGCSGCLDYLAWLDVCSARMGHLLEIVELVLSLVLSSVAGSSRVSGFFWMSWLTWHRKVDLPSSPACCFVGRSSVEVLLPTSIPGDLRHSRTFWLLVSDALLCRMFALLAFFVAGWLSGFECATDRLPRWWSNLEGAFPRGWQFPREWLPLGGLADVA